eukprot:9106270-Pyramimonas_sp.AAC.1
MGLSAAGPSAAGVTEMVSTPSACATACAAALRAIVASATARAATVSFSSATASCFRSRSTCETCCE